MTPMTDNDSGTTKIHVNLHLDPRVWREIKRLAIREDTSITMIAQEALMVYVKWLRKADEPEKKKEIREIMKEIRKEQKVKVGITRGRYKRKGDNESGSTKGGK